MPARAPPWQSHLSATCRSAISDLRPGWELAAGAMAAPGEIDLARQAARRLPRKVKRRGGCGPYGCYHKPLNDARKNRRERGGDGGGGGAGWAWERGGRGSG